MLLFLLKETARKPVASHQRIALHDRNPLPSSLHAIIASYPAVLQPAKAAGDAAKGGRKRLRKAADLEPAAEAGRGKAEADAAELIDDIPSPAQVRNLQNYCSRGSRSGTWT